MIPTMSTPDTPGEESKMFARQPTGSQILANRWKKVTHTQRQNLMWQFGEEVMTGTLPICPYGCGEPGQLREIVMEEGNAIGVFADSDGCLFRANIEIGEPPTKRKLVIGPDGQLKEEGNG